MPSLADAASVGGVKKDGAMVGSSVAPASEK